MTGSLYKTKRWERVSARKLASNPVCEGCDERSSRNVDHIRPLDKGGAAFDPANLQALCIPCHNEKSGCDKTNTRWIPPKYRGCDENGNPRDPAHPWGVASLGANACGAPPSNKKELV